MHFLPDELDAYVVKHSAKEPELLRQLTLETYQKVLQPRMLSGPYQGRVLSMISKLVQPKHILEIGTYTGYSALCLAEGMQIGGQLHTIDFKEELADLQRRYFEKAGYTEQPHPDQKAIISHLGEALSIIPAIDLKFDLVFIDADKSNYLNYYRLIMDKMNPGGIILSDNVLWSGKVVETLDPKDQDTAILLEYNRQLAQDTRLETVLLPIRDGLTISRIKTT
ncbi:O-methyltransferase [Croceiramulus getboli]|nr:O-methyltransferase [Flavobacteriaceae bacterium YJPT1-3]